MSLLLSPVVVSASPFENQDKTAKCYAVVKGIPAKPEPCTLNFANLNDGINSATMIYKNQIYRMSSQRVCDGGGIDTCYVQNELLEFGRSGKQIKMSF